VQLGYLDKPVTWLGAVNAVMWPGSAANAVARGPPRAWPSRKADCEPNAVREIAAWQAIAVGQQLTVDVLADVRAVDVTATCKGRSYAGTMAA
jgi:hypothetical protein